MWGRIDDSAYDYGREEEGDGIPLKKSADSEDGRSVRSDEPDTDETRSEHTGEDGSPSYHGGNPEPMPEEERRREREFRKRLNDEAREAVADSIHRKVKLIVHRPAFDEAQADEYEKLGRELLPLVRETARKTLPLLAREASAEWSRNRSYGGKFQADAVARRDYRVFAKKPPPNDAPALAVGLRIDESASMAAYGRLEAARRAAIAVYELCRLCDVPVLIYGDTADVSKLERMSMYAYADFDRADPSDKYRLMNIGARSNNRDGMALRVIADRLARAPQAKKLLISIGDGQPKAMDDYAGPTAIEDMRRTIADYERKGVAFLAAAIGQDKEVIGGIYGKERFLDITDLETLPAQLVRVIARYL
ncbi:vWA domain-containing protein [Cohnella sp. GCM10027633]|uniref:vWA domain-containing protein n=1 Tax=unclassified Cohnella TaxID=2636738 RepID=UPI0036263222